MMNCVRVVDNRPAEKDDVGSPLWKLMFPREAGEFADLILEDTVVLELAIGETRTAQMMFSFHPCPVGAVEMNGVFATVGSLHERCDSESLRCIIDWYSETTLDSTEFKDGFWYVDQPEDFS